MRRLALPFSLALSMLVVAPAQAAAPQADAGLSHRPVCGSAPVGFARCHADVVVGPNGKPRTSLPAYTPADLQSAYGLSAPLHVADTAWGPAIAIVDAFDDPTAEADLGVYRTRYSLGDCTTANGCFQKLDQRGGTSYPATNASWAQETSLDLDMASAICPACRIILVEGDSNSFVNLGSAVVTAAAQPGVYSISNSYGASEFSGETGYEAPYNQPGIAVTVSSGDSGYGVEFPAASSYVTAVGGTSLKTASNTRGWSETVWSGAGSGCSAYITKPSWQTDTAGCARRTVADVSAVADPSTGVAVYDSTPYQGVSGWLKFGGTSVASPIIASVFALAGDSNALTPQFPYANASSSTINDVTSGSNGRCRTYLCTGVAGYDGPTGLGTPNGRGAF